jgi:hypothetical protein
MVSIETPIAAIKRKPILFNHKDQDSTLLLRYSTRTPILGWYLRTLVRHSRKVKVKS